MSAVRPLPSYILVAAALVAAMVGRMGWLGACPLRPLVSAALPTALSAGLVGLMLAIVVVPLLVVRGVWRLIRISLDALS